MDGCLKHEGHEGGRRTRKGCLVFRGFGAFCRSTTTNLEKSESRAKDSFLLFLTPPQGEDITGFWKGGSEGVGKNTDAQDLTDG